MMSLPISSNTLLNDGADNETTSNRELHSDRDSAFSTGQRTLLLSVIKMLTTTHQPLDNESILH
jgi:hypothetical protein